MIIGINIRIPSDVNKAVIVLLNKFFDTVTKLGDLVNKVCISTRGGQVESYVDW